MSRNSNAHFTHINLCRVYRSHQPATRLASSILGRSLPEPAKGARQPEASREQTVGESRRRSRFGSPISLPGRKPAVQKHCHRYEQCDKDEDYPVQDSFEGDAAELLRVEPVQEAYPEIACNESETSNPVPLQGSHYQPEHYYNWRHVGYEVVHVESY